MELQIQRYRYRQNKTYKPMRQEQELTSDSVFWLQQIKET